MDDIVGLVCILGIVLGIVTVVGHGIWVLLSKIFSSAPSSRPLSPLALGAGNCPRCLSPLAASSRVCSACDWPNPLDAARQTGAALRALGNQLERFEQLGAIDAETAHRLRVAVESARQRRAAETTATKPPVRGAGAGEEPVVAEIVEPTPQPELLPSGEAALTVPPTAPSEPAERVREYAARRAEAQAESDVVPVPSVAPPRRREAVSKLLAAFMEEKNIRWGELVGGLLIVCCSIALVISFWSQIAERPLLKFVIFNGVTAVLFAIGFYTHRRWKLRTTSQGVLIIATLLVPLNTLAIAAFTEATPPTDVLSIGGEVLSIAVFSALIFLAARIITPGVPLLLVTGVMVPAVMQLLTRRYIDPEVAIAAVYSAAAVPIACYLTVTGIHLGRLRKFVSLGEQAANRLFVLLGVVTYATLVPLGLLLYKTHAIGQTLHNLSPLIVLLGVPALATGLLFWRQMTDRRWAAARTTGISIGVLGAAVMMTAVALAWPDPATLLPVAVANAVVFTGVAIWYGVPGAHGVAGACIAAAWLLAYHVIRGNLAWDLPTHEPMFEALFSAASGAALTPLAAVFAAVVLPWSRLKRRLDAAVYAVIAAVTAALSLVLLSRYGFGVPGDPHGVTWFYLGYAAAATVAAVIVKHRAVVWASSLLLLAALVQGLVYRFDQTLALQRPWTVAMLAHATLAAVAAMVFGLGSLWKKTGATAGLPSSASFSAENTAGQASSGTHFSEQFLFQPALIIGRKLRQFPLALGESALATSLVAAILTIVAAAGSSATELAPYFFWLSAVWLVLACLTAWPWMFTAFQAAMAASVCCLLTALVETRPWYTSARLPWLDPWFLQIQGIGLAVYCLAWTGVRTAVDVLARRVETGNGARTTPAHIATARGLLRPPWPAVDRCVAVGVVALLVVIACYAAVPGVAQELAPRAAAAGAVPPPRIVPPAARFEIPGISHQHAAGAGAWILLAVVSAMLLAKMWEERTGRWLLGLLLAAAMVCPLIATWWADEVSVASALRWSLAGFFVVASVPIWMRDRVRGWWSGWFFHASSAQVSAENTAEQASSGTRHIQALLFSVVAIPYPAMATYVAIAAVTRADIDPSVAPSLTYLAVWSVVALVGVLLLRMATAGSATGIEKKPLTTRSSWVELASPVLLALGIGPLLVATSFAVALALKQHPIVGPEPGALFRRMTWSVSYAVPVVVMAATLVGHAIHERSSSFCFSAGLLFNVGATSGFMLVLPRLGRQLDAATWVNVAQINTMVAALFSVLWLAAVAWHGRHRAAVTEGDEIRQSPPVLLTSYVALAFSLCGLAILPAVVWLFLDPTPAMWVVTSGSVLGWLGLVLTAAAGLWLTRRGGRGMNVDMAGLTLVGLTAMLALTLSLWDNGNWLAYHTLLVGYGVAAWLILLIARVVGGEDEKGAVNGRAVRLAVLLGFTTVLISLRAVAGDPLAPWWTVGGLLSVSLLGAWLAWSRAQRLFLYAAGILLNLATGIWWIDSGNLLTTATGISRLVDFMHVNVCAAALPVVVWVVIELRRCRPAQEKKVGVAIGGFHRVAALASVGTMLMTVAVGLAADALGGPLDATAAVAWTALVATAVAVVACLWDPATRLAVTSLYLLGLSSAGMTLDQLDLQGDLFWWSFTLVLAAFALATSYLWSRRDELRRAAAQLGAAVARDSAADRDLGWIVVANCFVAAVVTALVLWIELTFDSFQLRMPAAYAIAAQAASLALLARGTVRSSLQTATLVLGLFFAVAFGWACWSPDVDDPLLTLLFRTVVVTVALAAMTVLYGFGLVKLLRKTNEWTQAAARLVPSLVLLTGASVMLVIGVEALLFARTGEVPIPLPALWAVSISLFGLCTAALAAAILPGRDPLGLSQRWRTVYVYAAEFVLALLFVHIRLTMPWLFHGWFIRYWPLVAMGIAFVGVGLSEWMHRHRQAVLSEPLETTGALLPVLPVLGFWVLPAEVDYSLLLLTVGVLYAALSSLRRSFLYGMLGAVAANGSLWYLLYETAGLGLAEHPQLWSIPPALCVLVGAYLNRRQLTEAQMATVRYMAAIVIYASSTADIFINGVAEAPWLPVVLAAISLVGIFAGIMLRVRAFLYLGTSFLMVALFTIIWYAAVELDRTWIWWVSGIVAGVLIIALFAVFEKKRDDVLRLVEELKHWKA